jgi:hypothetical protein
VRDCGTLSTASTGCSHANCTTQVFCTKCSTFGFAFESQCHYNSFSILELVGGGGVAAFSPQVQYLACPMYSRCQGAVSCQHVVTSTSLQGRLQQMAFVWIYCFGKEGWNVNLYLVSISGPGLSVSSPQFVSDLKDQALVGGAERKTVCVILVAQEGRFAVQRVGCLAYDAVSTFRAQRRDYGTTCFSRFCPQNGVSFPFELCCVSTNIHDVIFQKTAT